MNVKDVTVIAVDAGKYKTKAMSNKKRFEIRTKLEVAEGKEYPLGATTIEWGSKTHLIGDSANGVEYDTTKERLPHKLVTYAAAANLIEEQGEHVVLIVGCPISVFLNASQRLSYKQYFGKGSVTFKYNRKHVSFIIDDVIVLPETIGIPYSQPNYYKHNLAAVIDIGGLNTNGVIYKDLKPLPQTAFTINGGGYIINNKIKNKLNSQLGLNFQDYEIPYILRDGFSEEEYGEKGEKIIKSVLDEHMREISDEMKKNNWNIENLAIDFIGGGSILMKDYIQEYFPKAQLSDNAVWANVEAFLKIGGVKYGSKKH